jgi:acyl-CoA synthetase (AMP-forming)/AMP-acid ligase II
VIPGDHATVESDGSITLLGRGSVCINSGGEKIFPEEVENALKSHPAVYDAVVVGVPDDRWGERVVAVIAPVAGAVPSLDSVQAHCRRHIAGYKIPRDLVVVGTVLRSPSGKLDYRWAKRVATGEEIA